MAGGWRHWKGLHPSPSDSPWCPGGPQSSHLQPGQHRHDLSQAACHLRPVGLICWRVASPLADLQMPPGPGPGLPDVHTQVPTVTASITIFGLRAPPLVSPGPDPYTSCFSGISSNSKCPVPVSSQPSAPPRKAPPSPGPQPCNHPGSPSPHRHTPSNSIREAHSFPAKQHPTYSPSPFQVPAPTSLHRALASKHAPPHPSPFAFSKSKIQPPSSSQLNVPFSRKPPCPMSQLSLEWSELPVLPRGRSTQEHISQECVSQATE